MGKFKIQAGEYFVWLLVNFIFCLLPIAVSALIIKKFDDSIFSSYIAYTYTLLISSLYVYENVSKRNKVLVWITIFCFSILLLAYVIFPYLLSAEWNAIIRLNFYDISIGILICVLLISIFLNKNSIEDQVQKKLNERKYQKAEKTSTKVKGFMDQLNEEGTNEN